MADTDTSQEGGEGTADQDGSNDDAGASSGADLEAEVAKWKALARKHEGQAKSNAEAAKKVKEMEDASKSDIEKATAAQTAAEKRAEAAEAKALRYEIALEKNVPAKLIKFLGGNTEDEIKAAADELLEAVSPADTGGSTTGDKPKEALRAGAAGSSDSEPEEMDPAKLAAEIPRL